MSEGREKGKASQSICGGDARSDGDATKAAARMISKGFD